MSRIHKVIIIILTIGFLLNLFIVFFTKQARDINREVISATRATRKISESVQIEVDNHYYKRLVGTLSYKYYKLNSGYNSEAVHYVLSNNSRLIDIIGTNKYASLYNLLIDIKLKGYDKEEFNIVRGWVNSRIFTSIDQSEYLNFLDYYYFDPIIDLFNNYEIDNAIMLAKQLFNRISMLSFPPLNYGDVYTNERISKMYLVCAFLNSPKEVLKNYDFFQKTINEYILKISYSNYKNISSEKYFIENNLEDYCNYLLYIYHFKNNDYINAYETLMKMTEKNFILYQLTLLQKARVVFWVAQDSVMKDDFYNVYTIDRVKILEECVLPSFKSDIEKYFF